MLARITGVSYCSRLDCRFRNRISGNVLHLYSVHRRGHLSKNLVCGNDRFEIFKKREERAMEQWKELLSN